MDSARVSVAHVLDSGVPFTWNDAVAVAQAAAALSDSNSLLNDAPSVVRSDTCFITTTGEVELPDSDPSAPPDGVMALLRQMLVGKDAPPDLLRVATGAAPGGLTALLTRFDTPDGPALIAALAGAALARRKPSLPSEGLLLRRRAATLAQDRARVEPPASPPATSVATAPRPAVAMFTPVQSAVEPAVSADRPERPLRLVESPPPQPQPQPLPGRRVAPSRGGLLAIAAAVGAVALAGVWRAGPALGVWGNTSPSVNVEVPPIPSWPLPGGHTGFVGAIAPSGATTTAAAVDGVTPVAKVVALSPSSATFAFADTALFPVSDLPAFSLPAPPAAPGIAAPSMSRTSVARSASRIALPGSDGVSDTRPDDAAPNDEGTMFSSDDQDVSPPALRAPSLPTAVRPPGSPIPADWPYLTVVVDSTGAVEQVRLRANQPKPGESLYRHQMLLAAAKAWRFAPATRNGRPVRYAIRVPLEP